MRTQPDVSLRTALCWFRRSIGQLTLIASLAGAGSVSAQDNPDGVFVDLTNQLQFSQIALSNWAPGGESSLSLNSDLHLKVRQKAGRFGSQADVQWLLGFFKTEDVPIRKNNDYLSITAATGYHLNSSIVVGALADLTTQVAPSYLFDEATVLALGGNPADGIKTGSLLAPGYLELGLGFRYIHPKAPVGLLVAPVTLKQTIIIDEDIRELDALLPSGLYGNDGETLRSELGGLVKLTFQIPLMENVAASGHAKAFTAYSDGGLDATAVVNLTGKINEHLSASVQTMFVYDNNVDTDLTEDGRQEHVQIREVLGVNLVYALGF